ncbi:hypothetical protein [Metabacillus idriensis]|uniref:hypothetical protein n=1 Tax=Metabacillus idriensis TaxID=324768 RepID=UPI003D2A9959
MYGFLLGDKWKKESKSLKSASISLFSESKWTIPASIFAVLESISEARPKKDHPQAFETT